MRLYPYIAWRYCYASRARGGITFITFAAVLGVVLGVAAQIIALAVMSGYRHNLLHAMAGILPHLSIITKLENSEINQSFVANALGEIELKGVSRFVSAEILLRAHNPRKGTVRAVLLRGIDTLAESNDAAFVKLFNAAPSAAQMIKQSDGTTLGTRLTHLEQLTADGSIPVLFSRRMAVLLGVKIGDPVLGLMFPKAGQGLAPIKLARPLRLVGYIDSGIGIIDEWVVVTAKQHFARLFFAQSPYQQLAVRLINPEQAATAANQLRTAFHTNGKRAQVVSWLERNDALFEVLRIQKWALAVTLALIVILAFLGMGVSLLLLVREKRREVAILKTLGVAENKISLIFGLQGIFIGGIGTVFGVMMGAAGCWALANLSIFALPAGIYPGSNQVPVQWLWLDVGVVVSASFAMCLLTSWFPARQSSALEPAPILQSAQ